MITIPGRYMAPGDLVCLFSFPASPGFFPPRGGPMDGDYRITSIPIYGRRTSGTVTLPSAFWYCSTIAGITRLVARPEAFSVWAKWSFLVLPAVFDVAAARLVVARVGRGANLLIDAHAGNPNFDIVGARHGEGAVARGELAQAVVEAKLLDQPLGLADQLLKGRVGALRVVY